MGVRWRDSKLVVGGHIRNASKADFDCHTQTLRAATDQARDGPLSAYLDGLALVMALASQRGRIAGEVQGFRQDQRLERRLAAQVRC